MKIRCVLLAFLCGMICSASAQLSVEVVLPQDKFLPGEDLLVGVRVVNRSGQTLYLGAETNWIRFVIERGEGGFVRKLTNPPVQRPFALESARQATLRVDVAPCYDLRRTGKYQIAAEVMIKNWDRSVTTKPKSFEIIEGTRLWEQAFGVPATEANQAPEIRSYSLQQANYLAELRLYLRVARSDGYVIKLINVGQMLSFGRPEPLLDKYSKLHLLHQTGPRTSEYLVVNPAGKIETRQRYEYANSRPRLRFDENGEIVVTGGIRRHSADDLPPESKPGIDHGNTQKP